MGERRGRRGGGGYREGGGVGTWVEEMEGRSRRRGGGVGNSVSRLFPRRREAAADLHPDEAFSPERRFLSWAAFIRNLTPNKSATFLPPEPQLGHCSTVDGIMQMAVFLKRHLKCLMEIMEMVEWLGPEKTTQRREAAEELPRLGPGTTGDWQLAAWPYRTSAADMLT